MSHLVPKLIVTLSKTAQNSGHYLQVMSEDGLSVNFVCIADEIEVRDLRQTPPPRESNIVDVLRERSMKRRGGA